MRLFDALVGLAFMVLGAVPTSAANSTDFSQSSATDLLRVIAVDIGPRPMGSPAEHEAMEFAVRKLEEFGCDTAYIMPMERTQGASGRTLNTRSGVAVGIRKGASGRIILLGAHIDSAGPEIPGANDDGSGTAVILELARVLSKRPWQSTLVFALFGGEEQGLRGSEHFVDQFEPIDSVALMVQVDMADGTPKLIVLSDSHERNAPAWLVRAAFEEFTDLGYEGLTYETYFNTFSSLFPRPIAGSDHEPFLRKGIPAIDFTSDIAVPIHSPQDEFSNFQPQGLKRSGDLVYRLIERFDSGVPDPKTETYWLFQAGWTLIFVERWALWTFIGVSIIVALSTMFVVSKRTVPAQSHERISLSGGKLFLVLFIIMVLLRASGFFVGLLKGWRHPGFLEPELYRILALLFGLVGIWVGIHLAGRLKLSPRLDAYCYRSAAPLVGFVLLLSLASVSVGFTVSVSLVLVCLAFLVRSVPLRVIFWLASPYPMVRLILHEESDFFARLAAQAGPAGFLQDAFVLGITAIGLTVWLYPFLASFVGIYKESGRDLFLIRRLKVKWPGIALAAAIIGYTFYLIPRASYSETWRRNIHVDENVDLGEATSSIRLRSAEYLKEVRITHAQGDTVLSLRDFQYKVATDEPFGTDWLRWERNGSVGKSEAMTRYDLELRMHFTRRPYRLEVSYHTDSTSFRNIQTPLAYSLDKDRLTFSWYSFPDTVVLIPLSFDLASADTVREQITATFDDLAYPLGLQGAQANFILRTSVHNSETMLSPSVTNSTSSSASVEGRYRTGP